MQIPLDVNVRELIAGILANFRGNDPKSAKEPIRQQLLAVGCSVGRCSVELEATGLKGQVIVHLDGERYTFPWRHQGPPQLGLPLLPV